MTGDTRVGALAPQGTHKLRAGVETCWLSARDEPENRRQWHGFAAAYRDASTRATNLAKEWDGVSEEAWNGLDE